VLAVCSATGSRARAAGRKSGCSFCTTDPGEIYRDPSINTVVIATRHHLHAAQIIAALASGKNVFCEKPICLTEGDLQRIAGAYRRSGGKLMVGFNRRFAPMAQRMKSFFPSAGPFIAHYRVNAGPLPHDHWINDPEQGGGRILGEMCHFVDFFSFLLGTPVTVEARALNTAEGQSVIATLRYQNGSLATLTYACGGDRAFSKEMIEVFGDGRCAALEDFRRLELVHNGKKQVVRSRFRQNKGHSAEWLAFSEHIRGRAPAPIAFDEIMTSTLAAIRVTESLRGGCAVPVQPELSQDLMAPLAL
jgi:predicted dehydrogenase